ncbi:MerR family transcriptional regulator [Streptococcus pluranimalium]|uniref:MerR family transcriptional regulator n=1 Tax=Streptococcus pluranimalium TaxID=82348 RepID=UPI003F691CC4
MSVIYTTGEMAKLAGVSIRTVQYYDQRGILIPSDLTEGGRRRYSESDLERLRWICFLRDLDFSIKDIQEMLVEEHSDQVLQLLLERHISELKQEIDQKTLKLDMAVNLLDKLEKHEDVTVDSLQDMSLIMSNQKAHRRLQLKIIATTFAFVFLLIVSIFLAQQFPKITWLKPFAWFIGVVYIVGLLWLSYYFSRQVIYLCPVCQKTFQPSYWDFAKAGHTPKTRKLTCPHCHTKSSCLELAKEESLKR